MPDMIVDIIKNFKVFFVFISDEEYLKRDITNSATSFLKYINAAKKVPRWRKRAKCKRVEISTVLLKFELIKVIIPLELTGNHSVMP